MGLNQKENIKDGKALREDESMVKVKVDTEIDSATNDVDNENQDEVRTLKRELCLKYQSIVYGANYVDQEDSTDSKSGVDEIALSEDREDPLVAPKRPLSAYNLFFHLQRQKVLDQLLSNPDLQSGDCGDTSDYDVYTIEDVAHHILNQRNAENCVGQDGSTVGTTTTSKKRKHRKTHGKISFTELARTIAYHWRRMKGHEKLVFHAYFTTEIQLYKRKLMSFHKRQELEMKHLTESLVAKEGRDQAEDNEVEVDEQSDLSQTQNESSDFQYLGMNQMYNGHEDHRELTHKEEQVLYDTLLLKQKLRAKLELQNRQYKQLMQQRQLVDDQLKGYDQRIYGSHANSVYLTPVSMTNRCLQPNQVSEQPFHVITPHVPSSKLGRWSCTPPGLQKHSMLNQNHLESRQYKRQDVYGTGFQYSLPTVELLNQRRINANSRCGVKWGMNQNFMQNQILKQHEQSNHTQPVFQKHGSNELYYNKLESPYEYGNDDDRLPTEVKSMHDSFTNDNEYGEPIQMVNAAALRKRSMMYSMWNNINCNTGKGMQNAAYGQHARFYKGNMDPYHSDGGLYGTKESNVRADHIQTNGCDDSGVDYDGYDVMNMADETFDYACSTLLNGNEGEDFEAPLGIGSTQLDDQSFPFTTVHPDGSYENNIHFKTGNQGENDFVDFAPTNGDANRTEYSECNGHGHQWHQNESAIFPEDERKGEIINESIALDCDVREDSFASTFDMRLDHNSPFFQGNLITKPSQANTPKQGNFVKMDYMKQKQMEDNRTSLNATNTNDQGTSASQINYLITPIQETRSVLDLCNHYNEEDQHFSFTLPTENKAQFDPRMIPDIDSSPISVHGFGRRVSNDEEDGTCRMFHETN